MNEKQNGATRRQFLKAAAAGSAVAANLGLLANVHAAGSDEIRVGLIGCGGRGTGAADNVLSAAPNVKLVAVGDAFQDRLDGCLHHRDIRKHGDKVDVPEARRFVGLDAYDKVIASDVNYIILATPPGFRPLHLAAAVAAGKHIFTEKPVATDAAGIRKVLAAYEEAKQKNLGIAAGTQRRHQNSYNETMKRIHNGELGDITAARCYWNGSYVWDPFERQSDWSDVKYQVRNWYYYVWLCGDHICEQHVHNLDVINWALNSHPASCVGLGGRAVRTDPKYGQIFDHFAVDYEYPHPSGDPKKPTIHVLSMCRQTPPGSGCKNNISEALVGSKGVCDLRDHSPCVIYTLDGQRAWASNRRDNTPYVQEHTDLIESIRAGKPINELKNVAESTLTAIMGRMSTYTGKEVKWDQALNGKEDLMPEKLTWETSLPEWHVPVPGKTKLI
jgi:myo-inositol 2-dehydrogenase / D-chiro-inositol 1-dehydrogenase